MKSDENNNEKLRHSCAHVLADAVQKLFPGTKLGIGPAIENGFYYDFDSKHKFVPEDLPAIEAKMKEIVKLKTSFTCSKISKEKAVDYFKKEGEKFKVELIKDLQDGEISIYKSGEFTDLCKGPHVENTGAIKHFKLTRIAGAYWRGDEKRPMLQRVYGVAFESKKELDDYLIQMEEAKKRDHRKLGTELDLFSIQDECGPGLVLWHPKGGMIRKVLEDWIRDENIKRNYDIVYTPHIARLKLWQISGHTDFYSENMFKPIEVEKDSYQLKPMNCPFHILIYKNKLRSYRDLPMRLFELGTDYRYERSGVVHGLFRVRGFTMDDAHIFCTPEQMEKEIFDCFEFAMHVFKTFGFKEYKVELSTRDESQSKGYTGSDEDWNMAQSALRNVLKSNKIPYKEVSGEAAFYGPKIDIKLVDAIGRLWQLTTIQFDFNLPERFGLEYVAESGRKRPLVIHRALLGSLERFFGILIEHYAGLFPLWLAPVQVKILTLTSNEEEYAKNIASELKKAGIRASLDMRSEKVGLKIREAHNQKIPYSIVIGGKEVENKTLTLRIRSGKNISNLKVDELIKTLKEEISSYSQENLYK
ncbi:MAG TPA: threonine--tRNA ligase [Elusimicrobiales bacterium]|nr:threonine--tRNA ligase [Elusimicrobiales bacterium]